SLFFAAESTLRALTVSTGGGGMCTGSRIRPEGGLGMRKRIVRSMVGIAVVLVPIVAAAQTPRPKFGEAGQVGVGSHLRGRFDYTSTKSDDGTKMSATTIEVEPAADYFVIDSLSVGGAAVFDHTRISPPFEAPGVSTTTFGIEPRVGFNLPLGDTLSFWPR